MADHNTNPGAGGDSASQHLWDSVGHRLDPGDDAGQRSHRLVADHRRVCWGRDYLLHGPQFRSSVPHPGGIGRRRRVVLADSKHGDLFVPTCWRPHPVRPMKVYLALTRPKLKRGAEWKLTAVNG